MKQDKIILHNTNSNDPVANGEIAYNATLGKFRKRENGIVSNLDTFPTYNQSLVDVTANAVDTYLAASAFNTANIKAGTRITYTLSVSKTAAGTVAPIFTVRFGTAQSTGDAARLTFTGTVQTAVVDTAYIIIEVIFRSVGTGIIAFLQGVYSLNHNLTATGFSTVPCNVVRFTSAGFDSTVANSFVGLSVNPGTAGVWTFSTINAELLNIN